MQLSHIVVGIFIIYIIITYILPKYTPLVSDNITAAMKYAQDSMYKMGSEPFMSGGGTTEPIDGEECRNYSYLNQSAPTGFTNNWLEARHNDQLFAQRYGDFPLYDEPRDNTQVYSNEQNNTYRDILKTIQVRSPLSDKFFSKTNVNHIKYMISKMIKNRKGYDISAQSQSDNEILIIMRSMFLQHAKHLPDNIQGQLAELNMKVLMDVVPRVETNIQMELTYQRDHGSQPLPLPRPLHISSAGTRSNRSVTDLFI